MNIINPLCVIRAIYYSVRSLRFVSGHFYEVIKEKTPPNVLVTSCTVCGKTSICWSWESMEDMKGIKK